MIKMINKKNIDDLRMRLQNNRPEFLFSIDCEGPRYDKNVNQSAMFMADGLSMLEQKGIPVILFLTPGFVNELTDNLSDKLKSFTNSIYGLHIHVEDLPIAPGFEIAHKWPENNGKIMLNTLPSDVQTTIIEAAVKLNSMSGFEPLGFRGGYFSADDATVDALCSCSKVFFESHNMYRSQYQITGGRLLRLPVVSRSAKCDFRVESRTEEEMADMLLQGQPGYPKTMAMTHSYCFSIDAYRDKFARFVKHTLREVGPD